MLCDPSTPGRIHRTTLGDAYPAGSRRARTASASRTRRAWPALGRAPTRLVVFAVEAADLGFGTGLSQSVADALPELTRLVLDELG